MLLWLQQNIGTILVCIVLLVVVGLIVNKIVRDKKQGCSSCGNNCSHCAMHGQCHNTH